MAESAKEAFKVINQVSEILTLVSDYTTTVGTVKALTRGVSVLAARSLGMIRMAAEAQSDLLTRG